MELYLNNSNFDTNIITNDHSDAGEQNKSKTSEAKMYI